jgi:glycosyltransferase involved in cell wall biosynthesis
MRVCLISTELAGFGAFGGFGVSTRNLACGLAARGLEVFVVMPRQKGQKPIDRMNEVTVVSFPSSRYTGLRRAKQFVGVYEMIDADVYHSQEPSIGTCLAQIGAPNRKHLVTFRDPRSFEERAEASFGPAARHNYSISFIARKLRFQTGYWSVVRAVRRADALFCPARFLIPKATNLYRLKHPPAFLPTPVEVPDRDMHKSDEPTVCFLGRWDPRKRPEYFFSLAERFEGVNFIAIGGCDSDRERDSMLRAKYGNIPNLTMPGRTYGEPKSKILEQSWILINTSWREGLPVSYLEACAHRSAILAHENADDFASNFGYWAKKGNIEDFSHGLEVMLENDRWKDLGNDGYEYVKKTHEFNRVMDQHVSVYQKVLGPSGGSPNVEDQ